MKERLRWELRTNASVSGAGDLLVWVEAKTEKWRYDVHPDWEIDGYWVAWRQIHFGHYDLGELWDDELDTFEAALRRAQEWHDERDSDFDLEWIHLLYDHKMPPADPEL
jgi:hypothetical protein